MAENLDRIMGTIDAVMSSFTLEPPDLSAASREDVLTLWGGDIETLDPALYTGSPAGIPGAIFSGLVSLDENMSVVPDIARTWSRSKDGTVYTFILQPDVVFHDGRRVTARDFKYAWERAADPATGSPTARTYLGDIVGVKEKLNGEATEVAGIRVRSELVLQVTIDAPKHHFLYKLAYPTAYVVDWANVKSGAEVWTDRPNGTGAFRLAEWRKGELMLLERNDHYHHEPATLSQVVFRLSGGPQVAMYERDEIDIARVTAADIDRMLDQAAQLNKHVLSGRRSCTHYLGFNVTIPPFDDPSVRQAFALALDVDKKLSLGLGVTARRASGVLPPGIPGHVDLVEPVPFDPARARALVAESRYGIAEGLPRIVSYAEDDALHWMWREHLGVEVEARSLPDRRDRRARLRAEGLPLWSGGWCADYPDAQNFLELLFGSDSDNNHFGYSNADVDERLARAAAEESPAARAATYREVERLVLDDWVAVPLWHSREYVLARPYIAGYGVTPIRVPFLHRIYFER